MKTKIWLSKYFFVYSRIILMVMNIKFYVLILSLLMVGCSASKKWANTCQDAYGDCLMQEGWSKKDCKREFK